MSDGTMPCATHSPGSGLAFIKTVPAGLTASQGHPGGHLLRSPTVTAGQLQAGHTTTSPPTDAHNCAARAGVSPLADEGAIVT